MTGRAALLTFNAGSSSLKFSLYHCGDGEPQLYARGQIDDIEGEPSLDIGRVGGNHRLARRWPRGAPFETLLEAAMDWVESQIDAPLLGAGHRVVRGAAEDAAPLRIDDAVLARLEALAPLMPLHQPHCLAPIRALRTQRPGLAQVACFDNAFHATLPRLERLYGLPREDSEAGILRIGYHGLSYEYLAAELPRYDAEAAHGRVIAAHLGNGASLCAMVGGRSVATTMGFSALDGLLMGTRCGALDPGALIELMRRHHYDADALEDLLYHRCGLKGVSGGIDSDMRRLQDNPAPAAREAVELFVYRLKRELGAMIAAAEGIDALVFTGGIGEHDPAVRAAVCAGLGWLGLQLDAAANQAGGPRLHAAGSAVRVWAIPAGEDRIIARHSLAVLSGGPP